MLTSMCSPMRNRCLGIAVILLLSGCSGIWNAGDLVEWVKDRAVDQGCRRDSIELDEWYTATAEGNRWCGTCRDAFGNIKSLGIDVDPVWKPSKATP